MKRKLSAIKLAWHRYVIIRITQFTFFTLMFSLHVFSQSASITLNLKNVPIEIAFKAIQDQSHYTIMYSNSVVRNKINTISVSVKNATIQTLMDSILVNQPLEYRIINKTIILTSKKAEGAVETENKNVFKLEIDSSITIVGRVMNAKTAVNLPGVTVQVKGSNIGSISNEKGEFTIKDVIVPTRLILRCIGYKPVEVDCYSNSKMIVVRMTEATSDLDKVVIQGYGATTQRFNTGNIVTVTSKEIERQPVMNVLTALQGKVPGMAVTPQNGYASSPFKIEIRGRKLLNDQVAPDPLIIIDGVPLTTLDLSGANPDGSPGFIVNGMNGPAGGQSPLFSLNPSDIESVTILKDADATAIYGSRGGSGVILINTKKGKAGKTIFDANAYYGFGKVPKYYKMMNTEQYLSMRREALKNDGLVPDAGNAPDLVLWDTTKYTNWQKELWGGTGINTDVQMSLSGGGSFSTFRVSGGYHKETGITNVSGSNQRGSIQFNLTHRSQNQKLSVSYTNLFSYTQVNEIGFDPNQATLPPNAPPIYDSIGNLNYRGYSPYSYLYGFSSLRQPYLAKTNFLNNQLVIKYEVVKGLSLSSAFGYGNNRTSQSYVFPISSKDPSTNPKGNSSFGNNNGDRWIIEPQVDYIRNIKGLLLTGVLGATIQRVKTEGNRIIGQGYIDDNLLYSVSNAPIKGAFDISGMYKYAAVFGRINFNFNEKYLVNISGRRDGSSRFGKGKQFGNFGSVGLGWIFSEEAFFKENIPFLSFGKVRLSYGITGSDNLGDYKYITRWTANAESVDPYLGATAYVPTQHANPNLQWQVNKKFETGLHLGILKDKISLEATYYSERCGNQLAFYPLPAITGFSEISANTPLKVENSGYEGILRASLFENKKISLSINFNIGFNRNKLLSFPNIEQTPYANEYFVGKPLSIGRIFHYIGVDSQTGLYTFEDLNKDGKIIQSGPNSDLFFRNIDTRYYGGLGVDCNIGKLAVNLFFFYQRRPYLRSAIYNSTIPGTFGQGNQSIEVLNHWSKVGDKSQFARYSTVIDNTDSFFFRSDGVFSNGSFIRLQNLAISYDFTSLIKLDGKFNLIKAFIKGENLYTITNYNGIDPVIPGFGVMPLQRVLTGGIQLVF